MRKTFLRLGSLMALTAVALGAFGSHGLRGVLSSAELNTFEIGVRYQFYHALALLAVGILLYFRKTPMLPRAGWLFIGGVGLFSGSLYFLSVSDIFDLPTSFLGMLTPIGGIMLMLGWAALIWSTFEERETRHRSGDKDGQKDYLREPSPEPQQK
ncbi:MAG: DUF423 domain-containing protein [Lewinellaceae bacterium]|nr:DUF423 domain-containing protein [Phaeodactylibacter sp.]MCB9038952.1 DUF423 domain-containing protein [Lewinellaceae bacterium]